MYVYVSFMYLYWYIYMNVYEYMYTVTVILTLCYCVETYTVIMCKVIKFSIVSDVNIQTQRLQSQSNLI